MAANGISTEVVAGDPVATKLKRRDDKLALAATKRQATGTAGYRPYNTISGTHNAYVAGTLTAESGTGSPTVGHPWTKV
jgi:hypothetical protein